MAPKKANPMEDPPAASSEEEEDSDEEETSSGEEEEDDEETPEPTQLSSPPSKQIVSKKPTVATPAKSSSSEDEETGSDSESESDPEPTPKPLSSKPMEETASKARSSKPVLKRGNETEGAQKDAKRKKKGTGVGAEGGRDGEDEEEPPSEMKKPGEEMKKQLFQRLWSEDDEIAVLKGMMEFSTKKGIDPNQDMNAFHDFIKKSLHIDVSRSQLMDKIRRLKKKYVNNLKRGIKKGEDVNLSKPHEQKAYELSKKIWGGEDGNGVLDSAVKSNGKAKKVQAQKGSSKQSEPPVNGPKQAVKMEVDVDKEPTLKITDVEKFLLDKNIGVAGLEDYVINSGLTMVGASKKTELEKRWKKLQIAQLELYVERTSLVREQAMLMLDVMKSSDDN